MNQTGRTEQSGNIFYKKIDKLLKILKFDDNTYKHSLKVAEYSKHFNNLVDTGIDPNMMYYSGLFHDIGKIEVDLALLNKKTSLDIVEFDIIKKHSILGYDIMKRFLMPVEMQHAAFYHHERWDGKGYPTKLKKQEIPLVARIISICDVFDALTTDRPYRKAFSIDEALNMMNDSKGQFDQELLELFLDNIGSIISKNPF
ncbi:MAG: HD domain-containing protein [Clostridiales bacterium]|nr:HD domain-containing protein [Clostridiales bacterium]